MIIYHSMILWIVVLSIYLRVLMWRKTGRMDSLRTYKVSMGIAILTFGYIIFWAGVRSGVVDTREYIWMYNAYPASLSAIMDVIASGGKAPLFDIFSIIFKWLVTDNYHAWFMAIAAISGICVMLPLRKYSENFMYSAFLFIVSLNFYWMLNGIRQFLVVAILFAMTRWIIEKKWKRYFAAVLILSMMHQSALMMIPIYWIVQDKPFNWRIMLCLIVLLVSVYFLDGSMALMEFFLEDTSYSGVTALFAGDDGVHPLRVIVALVPVIVAFIGRRTIYAQKNPMISVCVNMSCITAGLYFLGVFTSGVFIGRLPIYCEMYSWILLPWLFNHCFAPKSRKLIYVLCTVFYLYFYYVQSPGMYYVSDFTGVIY